MDNRRSITLLAATALLALSPAPAKAAMVFSLPESSFATAESGQFVWVAVTRNSAAAPGSVELFTTGGTAIGGIDFGVVSQTITFNAGESVKGVQIPIMDNPAVQSSRQFTFALRNPGSGSSIGSPSSATVTIVDDDNPSASGQWGPLLSWPAVAIHAHLTPGGRVVYWQRFPDGVPHANTPVYEWNPLTNLTAALAPACHDVFCSGHGWTADGKLVVAGGHIDASTGLPWVGSYNPSANTWQPVPPLNQGRWYPTLTTLFNGDLLVVAGDITPGVMNTLPQVLDHVTGAWRDLSNANLGTPGLSRYYPFMYQAPNGKVFSAGPQPDSWYLDTAGTGAWTSVGLNLYGYRQYGTSAMYDDGRVLIAGGNPGDTAPIPEILPSRTAEVIDLNVPAPGWRYTQPMLRARRQQNATILPDGTLFVNGGSSSPGNSDAAGAVFTPELWNPASESWAALAAEKRPRIYHSTSLLLPDGRVLSAGGGLPAPTSGGVDELNAQVYSPPYLFKGPRPAVVSSPALIGYSQGFTLQTPDAARISRVNLIRLGSVTHAFNESQRICRAAFTIGAGSLQVTAPSNPRLCPPGHYLLFLVDNTGVPAVAPIVLLGSSLGAGQADGTIRVSKTAPPSGDNLYNTSGASQTAPLLIVHGKKKWAQIVAGNDGPATDDLVVTAPVPPAGFSIRYLLGTQTGLDITAAVQGAGYKFTAVAPGARRTIMMEVTVLSSTPPGTLATLPCTTGSAAQLNVRDTVAAAVTVN